MSLIFLRLGIPLLLHCLQSCGLGSLFRSLSDGKSSYWVKHHFYRHCEHCRGSHCHGDGDSTVWPHTHSHFVPWSKINKAWPYPIIVAVRFTVVWLLPKDTILDCSLFLSPIYACCYHLIASPLIYHYCMQDSLPRLIVFNACTGTLHRGGWTNAQLHKQHTLVTMLNVSPEN